MAALSTPSLLLLTSFLFAATTTTAADDDSGAVHGATWWILHQHKLTQLRQMPTQQFEQWFNNRQWRQFMMRHPSGRRSRHYIIRALLEAAIRGVKRALDECQRQFQWERWNCSVLRTNEAGSIFGRFLLKGTPENAFVHAIISAGIVQSVAEACHHQGFCPCSRWKRPEAENFQWQGCDHNVQYGKRFARRMLNAVEDGWHIRFRMNAHNNKAGRRNVVRNMQNSCRCHGTSGSCTMKTCFRRTPNMRLIGDVLKGLYDTAVKVTQDNSIHTGAIQAQANFALRGNPSSNTIEAPTPLLNRRRKRPRPRRERRGRLPALLRADTIHGSSPQRTALVYYEDVPPDFYCDRRPEWNILGVSQRSCNSTSTGKNNCKRLCCSRGYFTRHRQVREQCKCRFVWCCRVDCEVCVVDRRYETCS